jgi:hypothetical protein
MQITRFSGNDWAYDFDGNKVSLGKDGKPLFPFTADGDPAVYDSEDRLVQLPYDINSNYLGRPPAGGRENSSDFRVDRLA